MSIKSLYLKVITRLPGGPVAKNCLPMQGTRVQSLVWEGPTCCRVTKPESHSFWSPWAESLPTTRRPCAAVMSSPAFAAARKSPRAAMRTKYSKIHKNSFLVIAEGLPAYGQSVFMEPMKLRHTYTHIYMWEIVKCHELYSRKKLVTKTFRSHHRRACLLLFFLNLNFSMVLNDRV